MQDNMSRRSILTAGMALVSPFALKAQEAASAREMPAKQAQQPPEVITDTRVESFLLQSSMHDDEPWRIHFARPSAPAPAEGYPVLYMLDGNASFPLAWHAAQALRETQSNLSPEQVAIVGIGYPAPVRFDVQRRFYDLTPSTAEEYRRARSSAIKTGGQDAFLDFIAKDVQAAIRDRIPVNTRCLGLFGHSLGGLFTLHALYTRPHLFQTYIAADPSIWWNGRSILQEETGFLAGIFAAGGHLSMPIRLLIENSGGRKKRLDSGTGLVAAEKRGMDRDNAPPCTSALDSASRLANIRGMSAYYRRFEDESHASMLKPACFDALSFFLGVVPEQVRKI